MKKRKAKKFACLTLISGALIFSNCAATVRSETRPDDNNTEPGYPDSLELTHKMGAGWNLGNTLDAHWNARPWKDIKTSGDQETLWGNPVTTKAMIDKVKASGFDTVRIPVTWYMLTGPAPEYEIADVCMDRVQEVVDYVIDNGMFCILNLHHEDYRSGEGWENGWLRLYYADESSRRPLSDSEKQEMHKRYGGLWKQIAGRFKEYGEYLIFEGINEPRTIGLPDNLGSQVWAEQCTFLNGLQQTFVDTVRAGGGKNPDRHLMISPFFASVGMDPNDKDGRIANFVDRQTGKLRINDPRNRLIVSLHYYEPWGFTSAPSDSQWFSASFDLNVGSVSHNLSQVLKIIEDNFVSKRIPVIMGETGAEHRDIDGHEAERVKWAEYYVSRLKELGVPVVIWDDGGYYKLFDRRNLEWYYPELAAALVEASKTPVRK